MITFLFSNIVILNSIYSRLFSKLITSLILKNQNKKLNKKIYNTLNNNDLKLLIGNNSKNEKIYVPESGLYQNFLITGTIGSGKTSSAMYPFVKQLIEYNSTHKNDKISMLILDVKGNFHKQIIRYVNEYNLKKDLIVLGLNSGIYFNPLHKPNLKASVLANRLKTILTLFSDNNTESYWLDIAQEILAESIKICRLYNHGYVTFTEIHKLITIPDYYEEKINYLKQIFTSNKLSNKQIYELNAALEFFKNDFLSLDSRTKGILISEISRITNTFISDYDVNKTFCPEKNKLNFLGFKDAINKGKIVVLNMNIAEYDLLSKIIATYLKLDFQTEILYSLSKNNNKKTAFICDEYDKYCTKNDSEFFSLSREAKCINIISTQSYSSLKNTLKNDTSLKVITQNLVNKIWFRTDDILTIEEAQKQLGKEEKKKISKTISENAKETFFNHISNSFNSISSNISESYNSYYQKDFIYDTNYFTQNLETFSALTFLSNGNSIFKPQKLQLIPYFKKSK